MRTYLALILILVSAMASVAGARQAKPFPIHHPLYCEFWKGNQFLTMPDAYMKYYPRQKTIHAVAAGAVPKIYKNVTATLGAPPYKHGYTFTVFGDVPVLAINSKAFDTVPFLAYTLDNHEATWGKVPGFPSILNAGLCFEHPLFPQDFMGW